MKVVIAEKPTRSGKTLQRTSVRQNRRRGFFVHRIYGKFVEHGMESIASSECYGAELNVTRTDPYDSISKFPSLLNGDVNSSTPRISRK